MRRHLLKVSQLKKITDPHKYVNTVNLSENHSGGLVQIHVKNVVVPIINVLDTVCAWCRSYRQKLSLVITFIPREE